MKLIVQTAVLPANASDDMHVGYFHTFPFEYDTAAQLKDALKEHTERMLGLNGNATMQDFMFRHKGYELDLRKFVFDGQYEEPDVITVHEFFKAHIKSEP